MAARAVRAQIARLWGLALLAPFVGSCLERRPEEGESRSACTACHGSDRNQGSELARSAPPRDLFGNTTPEYPGVGAHAQHLIAGDTHAPVACAECHRVPTEAHDPGHMDSARPAELVFGPLASFGGREPAYDGAARSCQNTYCHGASDAVWTAPRESEAACGSCHALPPPAPHPENDACFACHGNIREDGSFADPEAHVDGRVQVKGPDCSSCHGSGDNDAPPSDTLGNDASSVRGVGAHQLHLEGGEVARPVECAACHRVPEELDSPGHLDAAPAELTFSGAALSAGRAPSYDSNELTCSATWCHAPSADRTLSPAWTQISGQPACDSCHGLPPPAPHPAMANCSFCHGEVVRDDRTIHDRTRHVDGKVDVIDLEALACGACHGDPPPPALDGRSDTELLGVGAHTAHITGSERARAVRCGECHLVPERVFSPGHLDSELPAEVIFSGPATSFDARPRYEDGACQSTFCHGDSFVGTHASGGLNTQPLWNVVDGSQATCGSCHALPPPAPHPQNADDCSLCHETIDAERRFLWPETHVDGEVTFLPP